MSNIDYKKFDFNYSNKTDLKKYNGNSNKIDNQGLRNFNEVNFSSKADNEYLMFGKKVNLPYSKGIFGPDAIKNGEFGGYQGSLDCNAEKFIKDPKVKEIVSRYYSNVNAEDLELLFYRMRTVGCGYIAAINTLLFEYQYFQDKHSSDDFYKKFGFPIEDLENGYNYEYLFLDFFLFCAKEHEGYKTIEEVYGNAKEQGERSSGDRSLNHDKLKITGMDGTDNDDVAFAFQDYLKTKGINIMAYEGIPLTREEKIKRIEEDKKKGIEWNRDLALRDDFEMYRPIDEEIINFVMSDISLVMTISAENFPLYYPEDKDGNGKYDDVFQGNVGGHAMIVVGLADEPGKVVVSSWGEEYIMDISEIDDYAIYDYSKFNGVESSL